MSGTMLPTIQQEHESFAAAIFDGVEGIGDVQREETRRAFYAGCIAMMGIMTKLSDLPDQLAFQMLDRYTAEIQAYAQSLKTTVQTFESKT